MASAAPGARATAAIATEVPEQAEHRTTTLTTGGAGGAPGVRVITERVPSVRSVALGFWIATGSASESDEQAGISHLLEHMLFRGTERFGSEEIDQIFDAMGAEVNAGTDKEATSLYTRVLDGHLERAFDVMGDMIFHPRFESLETEREVVLEEIAMYEDDPQDKVFDVLGEAVFGSHPLGRAIIGTAEVVGAVTREQLGAFHDARYLPPRIVIAAAGSLQHDAIVELARGLEPAGAGASAGAAAGPTAPLAAGDNASHATDAPSAGGAPLATGAPAPVDPPWAATPGHALACAPEFARRVRFAEKDTEQYHVCVGGAGLGREDERRFALRVLEGALGGTSSSRLFREVRERRGLAYSVFSFSNMYAHTGEVGLYVGTRPDNLEQALGVIAAELERCVADPASEEELIRSRENLKGRVVLSMESTGARMSRLGGSLLHGLPILSIDEMIERIDAVELDDLRALAGELLEPGQLSIAGIGPDRGAFDAAIAPFGGAEEPTPAGDVHDAHAGTPVEATGVERAAR
jgi:predicted Zn-dependent peptidase